MKNKGVCFAILILALGVGFVPALSGCAATKGETTGQYVDDASITTSVKTKMAADNTATLTRVSVETVRGTVYLTGIVDSIQTKQRAAELAGQVKGVNRVVNNLQIQSGG